MPVSRISSEAITKIMAGGVNTPDKITVVVKFYSNECHYCHALSDYYIDISEEDDYQDLYFFAHNVDDDAVITEKLKLNGVPSIALFQTESGRCLKTKVLEDPEKPHDATWYTVKYIKDFINKER